MAACEDIETRHVRFCEQRKSRASGPMEKQGEACVSVSLTELASRNYYNGMFVPPFFKLLQDKSRNILMAGMGGGYDVFAAIPLYFELKE